MKTKNGSPDTSGAKNPRRLRRQPLWWKKEKE
jgi:hypothetical protein